MLPQVLDRIRKNSAFLSLYLDGMSKLYSSGILEFLREKAMTRLSNEGSNPNIAVAQAYRHSGYAECIDDLFNFKELYLDKVQSASPQPMFGAVELALSRGDITEKEADDLRSREFLGDNGDTSADDNTAPE